MADDTPKFDTNALQAGLAAPPQQDIQKVSDEIRTHRHDGTTSTKINFQDIAQLLNRTTTTPTTAVPRSVAEQLLVRDVSGSPGIHFWNSTGWHFLQPALTLVYTGFVSSGAAGTPFPTGWSITNPTTGNYQITHNLGTTAYTVVATPYQVAIPNITSIAANTFNINFRNSSFADANANFAFCLTLT